MTYKVAVASSNFSFWLGDWNTFTCEIIYGSADKWEHSKSDTVGIGSSGSTYYLTVLDRDVKAVFHNMIVTRINRNDIPCDLSQFACTCFSNTATNNENKPAAVYITGISETVPVDSYGEGTSSGAGGSSSSSGSKGTAVTGNPGDADYYRNNVGKVLEAVLIAV